MLAQTSFQQFNVNNADIEYISNLMLETEMPLSGREIARHLIERQLAAEKAAFEARYKDTRLYNPADSYEVGERLIFSTMSFATATVADVRDGDNPDYGEFRVIAVEFDEDEYNPGDAYREFAAALTIPHKLSDTATENAFEATDSLGVDEVLDANYDSIMRTLYLALQERNDLTRVGDKWFVKALLLEMDIGTMHLTEAVLDMNGGGPLLATDIIEQIGEVGNAPMPLQEFSLNLALNNDDRFDEVGPAGEVLWYLKRMEPEAVQKTPALLKYHDITYDEDLLTDEQFELETELDDEHTPIDFSGDLQKATTVLLYPHRRAGTLPMNAKIRQIFPSARTPRIYVELIDVEDDQSYTGWVIHQGKYVLGLEDYYNKHHLPIGAYVSVEQSDEPGKFLLSYDSYKPRTEWIQILVPDKENIRFESKKRAIGAGYDEMVIVGVDDLASLDALVKSHRSRSLAALLKILVRELGKMSLQGTVHTITLYSTVNLFRRVPPGPIFATLRANPEFEDVGDHYWKLND